MISYRSPASLSQRFDRNSGRERFGDRSRQPGDFAVSGWLQHHSEALTARFDANSYRVLLDAMDTHDITRGRGGLASVLSMIEQPVQVISITSDMLYVPEEQKLLVRFLPNVHYAAVESPHGHDGFLIDASVIEQLVRVFRRKTITEHESSQNQNYLLRPQALSILAC